MSRELLEARITELRVRLKTDMQELHDLNRQLVKLLREEGIEQGWLYNVLWRVAFDVTSVDEPHFYLTAPADPDSDLYKLVKRQSGIRAPYFALDLLNLGLGEGPHTFRLIPDDTTLGGIKTLAVKYGLTVDTTPIARFVPEAQAFLEEVS